ncbi:MAG: hypothetical protein MPJ24_00820 [Pirellulaceae bacterium]|nr:hypothetical protein [Pirellulaceae bacterium]
MLKKTFLQYSGAVMTIALFLSVVLLLEIYYGVTGTYEIMRKNWEKHRVEKKLEQREIELIRTKTESPNNQMGENNPLLEYERGSRRPEQSSARTKIKKWEDYRIKKRNVDPRVMYNGLKELQEIWVQIEPNGEGIPTREQLENLTEQLQDTRFYELKVYFFLPDMEIYEEPWGIGYLKNGKKSEVKMNNNQLSERHIMFFSSSQRKKIKQRRNNSTL